MSTLRELMSLLFANDQARVLIALVLGNLIVGLVAAWRQGDFEWERVSDFVLRKLFPLMVAWGVAVMLSWASPEYEHIKTAAWVALSAAGVANIIRNIREWGVPVSDEEADPGPTPITPPDSAA